MYLLNVFYVNCFQHDVFAPYRVPEDSLGCGKKMSDYTSMFIFLIWKNKNPLAESSRASEAFPQRTVWVPQAWGRAAVPTPTSSWPVSRDTHRFQGPELSTQICSL